MPHSHKGTEAHVCPWWLCPLFDNPLRRLLQPPGKVLNSLVSAGQIALDLGCGMGYFTIPLAKLVGANGQVIAVDLQEQMLAVVRRRARRAGVLERVRLHCGTLDSLAGEQQVDFALACWMVHEVPDQAALLSQVRSRLKPGGRFLLVEPLIHVDEVVFGKTVECARTAGLRPAYEWKVPLSRGMVLEA